jgi:hypothetical protein
MEKGDERREVYSVTPVATSYSFNKDFSFRLN